MVVGGECYSIVFLGFRHLMSQNILVKEFDFVYRLFT